MSGILWQEREIMRLTEDGRLLAIILASLQRLGDGLFVLFTPEFNVHRFGQVERSDEQDVHAVYAGNVVHVLHAGAGFDLYDDEQVRVALELVSTGFDREDLMSKGGTAASGPLGSEFARGDDSTGGFLRVDAWSSGGE